MSTPFRQGMDEGPRMGLKILSFDAGGPRGISQLEILQKVMESLSKDENDPNEETSRRPCDVFDAIGGVGTGGLIAMFLVVLNMTVEEALTEFVQFVTEVFENVSLDPKKQTQKLKQSIEGILQKHGVDTLARLTADRTPNPFCRLMVPVIYKANAASSCILRNYAVRDEPSTNLTVAEAMLATCAEPPIFTPTSISKEFTAFEYISGDVALSNPTREIIAEAQRAFGKEATVACLLSIGSGHPGTTVTSSDSDITSWMEFFKRVAMDCERTASEIGRHMIELDLYHRLSVPYGLEFLNSQTWSDPAIVSAHTTAYLEDIEVQESVVRCADIIKTGSGFATLEQLSQAGVGKILPSPFPPLASTYVEREGAMRFMEQAIFDGHRSIKLGSKRVVVTGIGGCGKTQLIRKFAEKHGDLFASVLFVDGSSKETLRSDVVQQVRSLGGAYSQASFDESMRYLSQPVPEGQRLLVIDNVDDIDLELSPFLPKWKAGTVIITSRNPSRGQLSPAAHLKLDVMTVDESVELLIRGMGWEWPPLESDKQATTAVAGELGCLPIALVQAISYMSKTGYSAEVYISRLRNHRKQLLQDPTTSQVDMRYRTAYAAFDASYEPLSTEAPQFLHFLSLFDSHKVSLELVGKSHPDSISASANLAPTYRDLGRHAEAEILGKEVLAQDTKLLGKDHPYTILPSTKQADDPDNETFDATSNVGNLTGGSVSSRRASEHAEPPGAGVSKDVHCPLANGTSPHDAFNLASSIPKTDQHLDQSPLGSKRAVITSLDEDLVDHRSIRAILPFLQVPFLLAERVLSLARSTKAFHVQVVYIARQGLRLVLLLNNDIAGNGPTDEQLDEKDTLQEQLVELHGAMKKWATNIDPQDQSEEEIELQYIRFFQPRFYFPAMSNHSSKEMLIKLRTYDRKSLAFGDLQRQVDS